MISCRKIAISVLIIAIATGCTYNKVDSSMSESEILQIHLKEFDLYFLPDSCKGNLSIETGVDKRRLEINLLDCKGQLNLKLFDSTNNLVLKGQYLNSLDTLKKYSVGKSAIDGAKQLSLMKYFEPLANGEWVYYKAGIVDTIIHYKNGLKIEM